MRCRDIYILGKLNIAWYACEAPLGKERYLRLMDGKLLDKSIHQASLPHDSKR